MRWLRALPSLFFNMSKFLYNIEAKTAIHNWLEVASSSLSAWGPACVLWLVGPSGIGKASLVKAWASEHDWEVTMLSADVHHNAKDVIDQMAKVANTQSFTNSFEGKARTRAMLIDDLDVFASVDRGFFGAFTECFKYSHWRAAPCICIVSPMLEKRVRDLRKGTVICVPPPTAAEIGKWQAPSAGCREQGGAAVCKAQIIECQGNMSYLSMMENEGATLGQTIDRALGVECLFAYPPLPRPLLRRVVLEDPWFHPLRFHENCISELEKRKGTVKGRLQNYTKIIDTFLAWDVLIGPSGGSAASHNQATGTIDAVDMATELIIVTASEHMGHMAKPKKGVVAPPPEYSFTKMLSHLSLQKKHRREQYDITPFGFPAPFFL